LNGKDAIVAYTSVEWENPGWETKYLRFAAEVALDMNLKGGRINFKRSCDSGNNGFLREEEIISYSFFKI